jgi:ABC-type sugar transport system substrate-binding protein
VHALVKQPAAERPSAIIIELVGGAEGYLSTARTALSSGIGWVEVSGLASSVPSLRSEFPEGLVLSVTTPEEDIGRIHATQCRRILREGGGILYIEGPSLQPEVKARRLGLEEGLRNTRIKIEKTLGGDWTHGSAERAMSTFFDRPHDFVPALVCAQNDEMAMGTRRVAVARDPNWAQIPYIGCDGLSAGGQKFVREGLLAATVVKPVTAGVAMTLVLSALQSGAPARDVTIAPESLPTFEQLADMHGTSLRPSRRSHRSIE